MNLPDPSTRTAAGARHWRRTLRLTAALLAIWFLVGFVVTWFARDLDFAFFGWPFSFWVAAQGGAIVFVALLAGYAAWMARFDRAMAAETVDHALGALGGDATECDATDGNATDGDDSDAATAP